MNDDKLETLHTVENDERDEGTGLSSLRLEKRCSICFYFKFSRMNAESDDFWKVRLCLRCLGRKCRSDLHYQSNRGLQCKYHLPQRIWKEPKSC